MMYSLQLKLKNNIMEIKWKTKHEIPTERWERNSSISPEYLVKCGCNKMGLAIIGYANYSYATNSWMKCYRATDEGIFDVEEWTDIRL